MNRERTEKLVFGGLYAAFILLCALALFAFNTAH